MADLEWEKLKEFFHTALALPLKDRPAYLDRACAGDAFLRQSVEALLMSHEASGFVDEPAYAAAANLIVDDQQVERYPEAGAFQAGQNIGRYRINSLLGEGGMGRVYLAQDTKLDRKVALKILPTHLASDKDRMRRFIQEAKTAAALNHPNIAQIFEIGEHDLGYYIAMEYVPGDTLRQLLSRRKIEINRAVELAAQVASGLSAAHNNGIIHRDIKPENLVVTTNGQIKVLDFGLAKLIERQRDVSAESELSTIYLQSSVNKTTPGVIMGTVSYMSPEQARGEKLDQRTDIFSLGVVYYELVTGDRPFKGKSAIDTLHAIINDEPPSVIELNPRLPVEISEILAKALAKDLNERYQHAGDFELDLRRFKRALESKTLLSAQAGPIVLPWRANRQTVTLIVIGVLFVLGLVAVAWMTSSRGRVASSGWSTTHTMATQLTNYGGEEASGALSPDGKSFVFVSERGGTPDLWLRQTAGSEPVRLTNDAEQETDPIYASDGQTIYFTRIDTIGPSIWRIGALGGQTRRLVGNARMAAPSPDGRSLSYFVPDADGTGDTLVVSGLDGSGTRTLARKFTGGVLNGRGVWSPDGRWLAYNRWELFAPSNLFVLEVSTGRERQVTRFGHSGEGVQSQAWLPDNRHLAVSYVLQQSSIFQNDLGVLDIEDGTISRLTFNIAQLFGSLSMSADGTRLVATAIQTQREVWKVPLGPDAETNGRAAVRVLDSSQDPMWTFVSRDGRTLLFNNATTGTRNLWTMPLDHSADARQITMIEGDNVMHSSLSPDGSRVAFASRVKGNSDIWTQNVDGSDLRQITNDEAADAWPVWSPDGEWIVFGSLRNQQWETRRVRAGGGQAEKIIDGFFRGDWIRQPTGDGTWLVSSLVNSGIRLIDVERHAVVWEERFEGGSLALPMFSPDGRFISVVRQESRDRDALWLYETATGKGRVAVSFPQPFKMYFRACWVDGGKTLVVNRYQIVSHIDLFDRFWMKEESP